MKPQTSAVLSGFTIILVGYSIFSATESPSRTLAILQYFVLALGVVGLIGSLITLARGTASP